MGYDAGFFDRKQPDPPDPAQVEEAEHARQEAERKELLTKREEREGIEEFGRLPDDLRAVVAKEADEYTVASKIAASTRERRERAFLEVNEREYIKELETWRNDNIGRLAGVAGTNFRLEAERRKNERYQIWQ